MFLTKIHQSIWFEKCCLFGIIDTTIIVSTTLPFFLSNPSVSTALLFWINKSDLINIVDNFRSLNTQIHIEKIRGTFHWHEIEA